MRLTAPLLIIALVLSCATTRAPALRTPSGESLELPPWTEVTSPHFIVHTDLAGDEATRAARELESMHAMLNGVAFPSQDPPTTPIEVILFTREAEFKSIAWRDWLGGFSTAVDVDQRPRLVMPAHIGDRERRIFLHELTHQFIHYFMPAAPTWLDEGMAKFYETMYREHRKNEATIGEAPYAFGRGRGTRTVIGVDNLPPASVLLAMKPGQFYSKSAELADYDYAASWFLVSMLITGPDDDRQRFWKFAHALTQGAAADQAWHASFDGVAIDEELSRYELRGHIGIGHVAYQPKPLADDAFIVRELRDEEAHLLWASMLTSTDARAVRHVAIALREAPKSAEAHYQAASIAEGQGHDDAALQELLQAIELNPDEPRYHLKLAHRLLGRELKKPAAERDFTELEKHIDVVAGMDKSANAQHLAARFFEDEGDTGRALPLAKRAVELDPTCTACLDTLARLTFASGDAANAATVEQRAIENLRHKGLTPSKGILDRLAKFQAAATAPPPAP